MLRLGGTDCNCLCPVVLSRGYCIAFGLVPSLRFPVGCPLDRWRGGSSLCYLFFDLLDRFPPRALVEVFPGFQCVRENKWGCLGRESLVRWGASEFVSVVCDVVFADC